MIFWALIRAALAVTLIYMYELFLYQHFRMPNMYKLYKLHQPVSILSLSLSSLPLPYLRYPL
jgi:hypothetical protein